jgi:hypothetical protein
MATAEQVAAASEQQPLDVVATPCNGGDQVERTSFAGRGAGAQQRGQRHVLDEPLGVRLAAAIPEYMFLAGTNGNPPAKLIHLAPGRGHR